MSPSGSAGHVFGRRCFMHDFEGIADVDGRIVDGRRSPRAPCSGHAPATVVVETIVAATQSAARDSTT